MQGYWLPPELSISQMVAELSLIMTHFFETTWDTRLMPLSHSVEVYKSYSLCLLLVVIMASLF